jgi:hypothetical protein
VLRVPNPRFTDNGNGTVTDNLTRLTWLKDWTCLGSQTWANALTAANTLADGNVACGLSDGSVAGDWRLPNINEFASVLDLSTAGPAFPAGSPLNVAGGGAWWSSTTVAFGTNGAWYMDTGPGGANVRTKTELGLVTAVRGGL